MWNFCVKVFSMFWPALYTYIWCSVKKSFFNELDKYMKASWRLWSLHEGLISQMLLCLYQNWLVKAADNSVVGELGRALGQPPYSKRLDSRKKIAMVSPCPQSLEVTDFRLGGPVCSMKTENPCQSKCSPDRLLIALDLNISVCLSQLYHFNCDRTRIFKGISSNASTVGFFSPCLLGQAIPWV